MELYMLLRQKIIGLLGRVDLRSLALVSRRWSQATRSCQLWRDFVPVVRTRARLVEVLEQDWATACLPQGCRPHRQGAGGNGTGRQPTVPRLPRLRL